jgi:hypothetical protein
MTHGPAVDAAGTWNEWYAPYVLPGNAEEAIRVRTSRRAVAAGSQRRARSIDESRSEAVGELLMHANRNRLSELHARAQAKGDKDAVRERLEELFETAGGIGADDSAWLPARLTIDDEPVEAIELEWDGWWLVLHVNEGAVADVWVSGPPDSKPDRLILEAIDTSAYTALS